MPGGAGRIIWLASWDAAAEIRAEAVSVEVHELNAQFNADGFSGRLPARLFAFWRSERFGCGLALQARLKAGQRLPRGVGVCKIRVVA